MSIYAKASSIIQTPQNEPVFGKKMIKNNAGGYGFEASNRIRRFLVLGTENGSYYASQRELTTENVQFILSQIQEGQGLEIIKQAVDISVHGIAPKNDAAIWAIAACSVFGDSDYVKSRANDSIIKVCRTGTHLFQFANAIKHMKGKMSFGAGQRRGINAFFKKDNFPYQAVKYQKRNCISMRDLIRLTRPQWGDGATLAWVARGELKDNAPEIIQNFVAAHNDGDKALARSLPREALPTEWLNDPEAWSYLLENMPMTAMIRNLGKMTSIGLLKEFSVESVSVNRRLNDALRLKKARIHPIQLLQAWKIYKQGHGMRGSLSWNPVPSIVRSLKEAIHLAIGLWEPTNRRIMVGIDASGSMTWSPCAGFDALMAVEAAACLGLTIHRGESNSGLYRFETSTQPILDSSLDGVMRNLGAGGATNGAAIINLAIQEQLNVDAFVIITDNESWRGSKHPFQALQEYRAISGINAKMVVLSCVANGHSMCDPDDPNSIDIVGLDSSAPQLISSFIRGEF